MSIRKTNFVSGEYYHIYNRGNDKKIIFHDTQDYKRFVGILNLSNSTIKFHTSDISKNMFLFGKGKNLVGVGSYCLMPNHFHIIITEIEEGGITKFMQKVGTAYSMYYNKKYSRTGSLFEGKFKSKHINKDVYFKYLFSYVHLNPIKLIQKDWKDVGIKNKSEALIFLNEYKYSSYLDYLGVKRDENIIINREVFPNYFSSKEKFQKEIFEWLSYKDL